MDAIAKMPSYEAYKDSGIDWIGSIPAQWEVKRFKFLLKEINIRSTTGDEKLLSLSKYSGVVPKDSLDERAGAAESLVGYKKVFVNDLVINKMQAVNGLLAISKLEGITSPDYSVYRPTQLDILDYRYLGYMLSMPEYLGEFKRRVTGVMEGFIRLYTDDLYSIRSILPCIKTQELIANFLDQKTAQIDDAIAIKEQQIALLKERKQIIIQKAVTQGFDPDVPMKNSGVDWIGEIPAHWEVKRAKYLFNEVDERSAAGTEELLSVSHMTGVTPRSEKNVSMFMAEDYSGSKLCRHGDLVINIMWAWMGAIGVSPLEGIVSPSYGVFREKKETFHPEYLEYLMKSDKYVEYYNKVSTGLHSSRLRFYGHMLFAMPIGYPSYDEQCEIMSALVNQTSKIDTALDSLNTQIAKLKEYKTTLINSAVTGKIRITPEMVA
jgi:type I restriction enzyme S subunit